MGGSGYDLGNVYGRIILDASGVASGINAARQSLNTGFANMGQSLQSFGDQITGVGARLTALTAPFTAFSTSGLKVAADFDVLMKQIELFGGVTGEELNSVREYALQMGADTKFSAQDAGAALLDLLKSGQDLDQAMATLPEVLNLAAAGEMSLAQAAGIASGSMAMFQMDTDKMNESLIAVPENFEELQKQLGITDAMFTAFGQEELGTQLDAFAEQLGVSAWDVYAMWDQTKVLTPELESLADQLGITTLNWAQLSEALYENKGFGYQTALTPAMEELARLTDLDVSQLADMFMEGISPSSRIVDALAQAANASRAEVSDLGQALTNVGPVANNFGMDVEEVAATLAVFADNGLMGAEAGTQLKSMLLNMSRPTREVKAAYKELDVSMYNANGTVKDFNTFILELDTALDALPVKRQNELMQELGGSYGIVGLSALRASDGIGGMLAEMASAPEAGALAEGFMDTFAGKVESLRGSFETLKIQAMTPFMNEVLGPFVDRVTLAINAVTQWASENPELTTTIMQIGTALAVAGPGLMATGLAVSNVGFAVKTVAPFFGLLTSPIGLIAGAGLVLAKVFNVDLKKAFEDTVAVVIPALQSLYTWFVEDALPEIVDFVETTVVPIFERIGQTISDVWTFIAPILGQLYTWFVSTALPAVANFIDTVFVPALEGIGNIFREIWETVSPILGFLINWFVTTGIPIIVGIINDVVIPAIGAFVNVLGAIWNAVAPALQTLIDWFQSTGWPLIEGIINNVITPAINFLVGVLKGIWEFVEPVINELVNWFNNVIAPAIDVGAQFVTTAIDAFILIFTGIWTGVQSAFDSVTNWFNSTIAPAIDEARTKFIQPAVDAVIKVFTDIWNWAKPGLEQLVAGVRPFFDEIGRIIGAVVNEIKKIPEYIQKAKEAIDIFNGNAAIVKNTQQAAIGSNKSQHDIYQNAYNELKAAGGGGVFGDILGTLFATGITDSTLAGRNQQIGNLVAGSVNYFTPPMKDNGGEGLAMMPYLIGKPQENNEIFVPRTTGDFIPNFMEKLESFMNQDQQGVKIGTVVIQANNAEGGRNAGDAFVKRVNDLMRGQG